MLRGYALYLSGLSDGEILENGLTDIELGKIKKFHGIIVKGSQFLSLAQQCCIDQAIAKQMWCMFYDHQKGKSLHFSIGKPLRVIKIFKLLLSDCRQSELEERGFNELEIAKAREFLRMARSGAKDKMLTQSMADQLDVPRSSIRNMLKLYNKCTEGGKDKERSHYPHETSQKIIEEAVTT